MQIHTLIILLLLSVFVMDYFYAEVLYGRFNLWLAVELFLLGQGYSSLLDF